MDVQLQELIDKIKSDGVAAAEKRSAEIVEKAEVRAKAIISEAEEKANTILEEARQKENQIIRSGNDALTQAARDVVLNLRSQITAIFDTVIRDEAAEAMTGKALETAILKLMESWSAETSGQIDLVVSESDLVQLEKQLRTKLAKRLSEGMEIKAAPGLNGGFRISMKDGSAYYNFTPSEIANVVGAYLNPKLSELLRQAAG